MSRIEVRITPGAVTRWMLRVVAVLVALDLAALAFALITGHDNVLGLLPLIDLDKERNLGTLVTVVIMVGNAALFWVAAHCRKVVGEGHRVWRFLAVVFLYLSFDEFAWLHERLMGPMGMIIDATGFLTFAWVIPYGILVLILAAAVGPEILRLEPETRRWFVISAVVYLSGALGLELVGGWRLSQIGGEAARPELVYELITTVEEVGELVGLTLLTHALLTLIGRRRDEFDIKLVT